MPPDATKQNAPAPTPAPRGGLRLMALIVIGMALLAIYSNYQNAHRDQIETVTIAPASPRPSASPSLPPPSEP